MTLTMEAPPVQYVKTTDGFNLACGTSGSGRPLVFLPLTFSHVQVFWDGDSVLREWLRGLAARFQLIQYDGRGQGMSSRDLPESHSALDEEADIEAVIARLGLQRFVLMARGPLGHAAIRYAVAHPQRVEALILFSLPASGSAWPKAFAATLAAENWNLFLQSFTAFDGRLSDPVLTMQRMAQTVNQADWRILIRAWIASDVRDILTSIQTPTLVVHPRGVIQPSAEESMNLAAQIPGARMLVTDGATQLGEPGPGLKAIDEFLARLPGIPLLSDPQVLRASGLSARQAEVLRLIAEGRTTREIAERLVLSERTVERHIAGVYAKIGARNRAEATAFALSRRGVS